MFVDEYGNDLKIGTKVIFPKFALLSEYGQVYPEKMLGAIIQLDPNDDTAQVEVYYDLEFLYVWVRNKFICKASEKDIVLWKLEN